MSILEEFWYGNLDPAEYDACPSKDYKEMLQLISRKELFSRYTDCVRDYQAMAECVLLRNSFRLGARIMLGVMKKERLRGK